MSTNAYVDRCPDCGADTCLNNKSTRPRYHSTECWTCGMWTHTEYDGDWDATDEDFGKMTDEERIELKEYMEGVAE